MIKNIIISIWLPCLNFAIRGVTYSLAHRIRCTPVYIHASILIEHIMLCIYTCSQNTLIEQAVLSVSAVFMSVLYIIANKIRLYISVVAFPLEL